MAAVTSVGQVCNLALGLVGQKQLVDNIETEKTAEAIACKTFYATARNEVLEAMDWQWARKRAVLALSAETRDGWGYCYAAPTDMLSPRRIWNGLEEYGAGEQVPFRVELNDAGTGHLILTNMSGAILFYTREVTTPALWRTRFVKAVATQLAVYLASMLPVLPGLAQGLDQRAMLALQQAAADDFNAQTRGEPADAEWVRDR